MQITQALCAERVVVNLAVADRAGALRCLASTFASDGSGLDAEEVHGCLVRREALASTRAGDGLALPHARVAGLGAPRLAVAIAREGVDFDHDGERVHILVAMLSDEADPRAHLALLAKLARTLEVPAVRAELASARSAEQVLDALAVADGGGSDRPERRRRIAA